MNVKGWNCTVIDSNNPLTCPACGELIPNPNVINGDFCYSPVWRISTDKECEENIAKAFKIDDPLADFFICQQCFTSFGQLSPVWWICKWIEEDSKLLSREQVLAMLEGRKVLQEDSAHESVSNQKEPKS
ncbi:MAG: hypothetical protein JNM18_25465 [Planctomycetaceae bacterium]|nr:hypothetical protein [Planctomycetaceae bacterium]